MAEGPPSLGVAHINKHSQTHFNGYLECKYLENKGRVLYATRRFDLGEIILQESPLHIVKEGLSGADQDPPRGAPKGAAAWKKLRVLCTNFSNDFDYEPLWYWCALCSLTDEQLRDAKAGGWYGASPEQQHNLLLLHHDEVTEPSTAASILVRELCPGADAIILERLIQIWVLNCFEYSDSPQGYSTYFFSSFMSHSCFPNAVWHYTGADHVLRARREIEVGDEVCISYLPEDGLLQATPIRRWELHETKRFWCTCERCCTKNKDLSRGCLCPKCNVGKVFATTPREGPAKSADLLASEFVASVCAECGHKLGQKEAEVLAGMEKDVKAQLDVLSEENEMDFSDKKAKEIEAIIDSVFTQHALADRAWEMLAEYYETKKRRGDQRRFLERRRLFHAAAYPGLSGAHAWVMEAYGDALKESSPSSAGRPSSRSGSKYQVVAKADPKAAAQLYKQALEILTLMFGEEHEYVTQVQQKVDTLS
mmetsp:Transcript_90793/g.256411  ORF Transcript_90793/g.256411 Transcript_90793/m.256411 type:complete len:480 (-) Transcript_90793:86-1525(-)